MKRMSQSFRFHSVFCWHAKVQRCKGFDERDATITFSRCFAEHLLSLSTCRGLDYELTMRREWGTRRRLCSFPSRGKRPSIDIFDMVVEPLNCHTVAEYILSSYQLRYRITRKPISTIIKAESPEHHGTSP